MKRESTPGEQTSGDGGGGDGDGGGGGVGGGGVSGICDGGSTVTCICTCGPVWWCVSRLLVAAAATPNR